MATLSVKGPVIQANQPTDIKQRLTAYFKSLNAKDHSMRQMKEEIEEKVRHPDHFILQYKDYQTELMEFWADHLNELNDMTKVEISFIINDNGDVLVRLRPTDKQREMFDVDQEERIITVGEEASKPVDSML